MVDQLLDDARRDNFLDEVISQAYEEVQRAPRRRRRRRGDSRSAVKPAPRIPTPPFWGSRVVRQMPLEIVLQRLHKAELYRLSWGAKNKQGAEWRQLQSEFEARLGRMSREAQRKSTLCPQAVYAYLPANSDGDELIVWDADVYAASRDRIEVARFRFPAPARWRTAVHQRLFRARIARRS